MHWVFLVALSLSMNVSAKPRYESRLGPIDLDQTGSCAAFVDEHGQGLSQGGAPAPAHQYYGLGLTTELWLTTGGGLAVSLGRRDGQVPSSADRQKKRALERTKLGHLGYGGVSGLSQWQTGAGIGLGDSSSKFWPPTGSPIVCQPIPGSIDTGAT